jgi:hypothetical protein
MGAQKLPQMSVSCQARCQQSFSIGSGGLVDMILHAGVQNRDTEKGGGRADA